MKCVFFAGSFYCLSNYFMVQSYFQMSVRPVFYGSFYGVLLVLNGSLFGSSKYQAAAEGKRAKQLNKKMERFTGPLISGIFKPQNTLTEGWKMILKWWFLKAMNETYGEFLKDEQTNSPMQFQSPTPSLHVRMTFALSLGHRRGSIFAGF